MWLKSADSLVPGNVLEDWHDTGAFGNTLCYARLLKVTKTVLLRVRFENGTEKLRQPWRLMKKVAPETVTELRADGVDV